MAKNKTKTIFKRQKRFNYSDIFIKFITTFVVIFIVSSFLNIFRQSLKTLGFYLNPPTSVYAQNITTTNQIINIKTDNVISNGSRERKEIALTFDADMTYGMMDLLNSGSIKSLYNENVINLLKKENVKATIFLTGLWAKTYPEYARQIANNPLFEIGNHTYSHPGFTNDCFGLPLINEDDKKREILDTQSIIFQITQKVPQLFRFPGGCFNDNDLKIVSSVGLKTIGWDTVSSDSFNENTKVIIEKTETEIKNGSIVVLHLNEDKFAPKTYEALLKIIPDLKNRGYKFVTVSEMFLNN